MENSLAKIHKYKNLDLLWISDDMPPDRPPGTQSFIIEVTDNYTFKFIKQDYDFDPSTIHTRLPVVEPARSEDIEKMGYWPSYYTMTPQQRYIYLSWLQDTTQQIDMGYVFTYYYGLERHLLIGNSEKAFEEIVTLRKYHKNNSFQKYSRDALIFSCLQNKDVKPLLRLTGSDEIEGFTAIQLLITHLNDLNLGVVNLMWCFCQIDGRAKKAYKENADLFLQCIFKVLSSEGLDEFNFGNKYHLSDCKIGRFTAYSNYTFPKSIRFVSIPDFFTNKDFVSDLTRIFNLCNEKYISEKAIKKQAFKLIGDPKDLESMRIDRDIKRLKKLFDSGALKKWEYELLINSYKSPVK